MDFFLHTLRFLYVAKNEAKYQWRLRYLVGGSSLKQTMFTLETEAEAILVRKLTILISKLKETNKCLVPY